MLEFLGNPGMVPFGAAFGIVLGLLLLEVVAVQFGLSLMGGSADTEIELDVSPDADFDGPETEGTPRVNLGGPGALGWLGLGEVPFSIWLVGLLTAFALLGYGLQMGADAVLGAPLPAVPAVAIVILPALLIAGWVARVIARILPREETTAIARHSYGRRRGVITVGTATALNPAQARFTDAHGNFHYAMVTPLDPADTLPQGTEIAIMKTREGLRAVRVSD